MGGGSKNKELSCCLARKARRPEQQLREEEGGEENLEWQGSCLSLNIIVAMVTETQMKMATTVEAEYYLLTFVPSG